MKIKEEKSQKRMQSIHSHKISFWKANWALVILVLLALLVILALVYVILSPYWNKKSLENDISNMETTALLSVDKVVCYSSAYGINNSESQARWNLNLSQYTDIAIYLNVQTNITNMFIDNISFTNSNTGNLNLSHISVEDFGKSPILSLELPKASEDIVSNIDNDLDSNNINDISETTSTTNNVTNTIINYNAEMETPEKINLDLILPITLRYSNNNLKENCLISDIETPLSFDGSILKRGKVTISSLKNTISFNLHVINSSNQEFVYPISIPINLENTENGESIYNGSYTEEIPFSNAYFYVRK